MELFISLRFKLFSPFVFLLCNIQIWKNFRIKVNFFFFFATVTRLKDLDLIIKLSKTL